MSSVAADMPQQPTATLPAEGRGEYAPVSVVRPVRCRFVPQSPAGFVGNVTTLVRAGEPSAESFDELSPRQLAQRRVRVRPVPALLGAIAVSGGSSRPLIAVPLVSTSVPRQSSRSARNGVVAQPLEVNSIVPPLTIVAAKPAVFSVDGPVAWRVAAGARDRRRLEEDPRSNGPEDPPAATDERDSRDSGERTRVRPAFRIRTPSPTSSRADRICHSATVPRRATAVDFTSGSLRPGSSPVERAIVPRKPQRAQEPNKRTSSRPPAAASRHHSVLPVRAEPADELRARIDPALLRTRPGDHPHPILVIDPRLAGTLPAEQPCAHRSCLVE